jgi:pimeloyl-ACP methyl ester carboxylesterase
VIVAHSMGGLAARACLAERPEARCHRLVTIASPHAGTRLGAHGRSANIAQMRLGSAWLAQLAARESVASRERLTCFWSHCDNIVFPTRSATLAGADNRHLPETPHVQMVEHPAVFEEVLRIATTTR